MPNNPSKVILITGCSSGFGFLMAARLAAKGHHVYATMRDLSRKDYLLLEAKNRGGSSTLEVLPMDVTKPSTIKAAVTEIVAREGVIDVLVNNAGFGVGGFFEDLSDKDWRAQYDVNFFGVLNVTREVLPVMRPRKQGKIINISSLSAFSGTPAFSAYCSSKWALEGFSECLFMELKQFGIDVVLVEPGSYRTKIFEANARFATEFDNRDSAYFRLSQYLRDMLDKHIRNNHRSPEEIARVVEDIVDNPSPSFRNIVGFLSKMRCWVVHHMPFKLYAWAVCRVLLPKK